MIVRNLPYQAIIRLNTHYAENTNAVYIVAGFERGIQTLSRVGIKADSAVAVFQRIFNAPIRDQPE